MTSKRPELLGQGACSQHNGTYCGPVRILYMDNTPPRRAWLAQWDFWPLTRLLLVIAALGLWAHWRFGWNLPTLPQLERYAFGQVAAFSLCAMLSSALARLYLAVLLFPLYVTVVLNDWFYEGSRFLLRLVSGLHSPRGEAGCALAGEIGLFVSLWRTLEFLARNYCRF